MDNDVLERLHKGVKDIEAIFLDTLNRAQKEHEKKLSEAERNNDLTNLKLLFLDHEKLERDFRNFKKIKEQLLNGFQLLSQQKSGLPTGIIDQIFNEALDNFSMHQSISPKNMVSVEGVLNRVKKQLLNAFEKGNQELGKRAPASTASPSAFNKFIKETEGTLKRLLTSNESTLLELKESRISLISVQSDMTEMKGIITKELRRKQYDTTGVSLRTLGSITENTSARLDSILGKLESCTLNFGETQRRIRELTTSVEGFWILNSRDQSPTRESMGGGVDSGAFGKAKPQIVVSPPHNEHMDQLLVYLRPLLASGDSMKLELTRYAGLDDGNTSPPQRMIECIEEYESNAKVVSGLLNTLTAPKTVPSTAASGVAQKTDKSPKEYYLGTKTSTTGWFAPAFEKEGSRSATYLVSPLHIKNKDKTFAIGSKAKEGMEESDSSLALRTLRVENNELQKEVHRLNSTLEKMQDRVDTLQKENMQIRFSTFGGGAEMMSNYQGGRQQQQQAREDEIVSKLQSEYDLMFNENTDLKKQLKRVSKKAEDRKISLKKMFEILNTKNNELEDLKKQTAVQATEQRRESHHLQPDVSPSNGHHTHVSPDALKQQSRSGTLFDLKVGGSQPQAPKSNVFPTISLMLVQQQKDKMEKLVAEKSQAIAEDYAELRKELAAKVERLGALEKLVEHLKMQARQPPSRGQSDREDTTPTSAGFGARQRGQNSQAAQKAREMILQEDENKKLKGEVDKERELTRRLRDELADQKGQAAQLRERLQEFEYKNSRLQKEIESFALNGSEEEVWRTVGEVLAVLGLRLPSPGEDDQRDFHSVSMAGLSVVKEKIETLAAEKQELDNIAKGLNDENEDLKIALDGLKGEKDTVEKRAGDLQKERANFFSMFSQIIDKNECVPIRGDIRSLDDVVQMIGFMIDDYSYLKNEVAKSSDQEIQNLKEENTQLQDELSEAQKELEQKRSEVDALEEKLTSVEKTSQQVRKGANTSEESVKKLEKELDALRKAKDEAVKQLEASHSKALKESASTVQEDRKAWEKEKRALHEAARQQEAELERLRGENAEMQEMLQSMDGQAKEQLDQMKSSNVNLKDQLTSLNSALQVKDEEVVRLVHEKMTLTTDKEMVVADVEDLKKKCEELTQSSTKLKNEVKNLQADNSRLNERLKILQNEDTTAGQKLSQLGKEFQELNAKYEGAARENDQMKAEAARLKQAVEEAKAVAKKAEGELKSRVNVAEQEREKLLSTLGEKEAEIKELNEVNERLKGTEALLGNMSSIIKGINETVAGKAAQRNTESRKKIEGELEKQKTVALEHGEKAAHAVTAMKEDLEKLKKDLHKAEGELESKNGELEQKVEELKDHIDMIKNLRKTNGEIEKANKEHLKALETLKSKVAGLEQELKEKDDVVEVLKQEKGTLISDVAHLQDLFTMSLRDTLGQAWKGFYEVLEGKLSGLDDRVQAVTETVFHGRELVRNMRGQVVDAQQRAEEEVQKILRQVSQEKQGKSTLADELAQVKKRVTELEKEISKLTKERDGLLKDKSHWENEVKTLQDEVAELVKTNETLGKERQSRGQDAEGLKKEVETLREQAKEAEKLKKNYDNLMKLYRTQDEDFQALQDKVTKLENVEEQKDKMEEEVRQMKKNLEKEKEDRIQLSARANELGEKGKDLPMKISELEMRVAELEQEVEEKNQTLDALKNKHRELTEQTRKDKKKLSDEKEQLKEEIGNLKEALEMKNQELLAKKSELEKQLSHHHKEQSHGAPTHRGHHRDDDLDLKDDTINIPDLQQGGSDPFEEIINDPSYIIEKEAGANNGGNITPENPRAIANLIQRSGDMTNLREILIQREEECEKLLNDLKSSKITEEQLRGEIRDHQSNEEKFRMQFQIFKEELVKKEDELMNLRAKVDELSSKMKNTSNPQEKEQMKKIFIRFMEDLATKNAEANEMVAVLLRFLNANDDDKRLVMDSFGRIMKKKGFFK